MSGGRVDESEKKAKDNVAARKATCDDWFSKYVITPFHKYIILWNIFMTFVYITAIIMDTLIIGFHLKILLDPDLNLCQSLFSFLMIIDISVKFFIGVPAQQTDLA